ncbi:MAG: cupin domain-containing protein [Chloroflexi bacterium]|nr:cupin domain-containing protein [Chloroflexota bacterium]
MSLPYRAYLYLVLAASAIVTAVGLVTLGEFAIDDAWPGRVTVGRATQDLARGLALALVAGPVWLVHWRLAQRQVKRDPREAGRFLREAYLHVVLVVSIILLAVNGGSLVRDLLEGRADALRGDDIAALVVWGAAWAFHWRVARRTWQPGHAGRSLHRWYVYAVSGASLVLLAFGISSILAELLRFAYEETARAQVLSVSGPWSRELRGGLTIAIVGGIGWVWHWWVAASGDAGSKLREVYATGASVAAAASMVSTVILIVALLLRPAVGGISETLAARWDGLPRLIADMAVAAGIWIHLSAASPWSRRGIQPADSLPGAATVDARAWEVLGLAAAGAGMVIAIALLLSLPVAAKAAVLVSTSSRLDAIAAIIATSATGAAVALTGARRSRRQEALGFPAVDTASRFFHFGIAAVGLLAAVGGAAAALFAWLNDLLAGEMGFTTLLDARWGIAIGLVGGLFTLWRWRAIAGFQIRKGPEAIAARPGVKVIHPDQLEVEVSSGAMTRLAGVSRTTVGAEGIHLAIATIPPGHRSSPHYHTNCESAIYVASGHGKFLAGDNLEETLEIGPGDFLYVPPDAPHQPVNDSQTEPLVLIVARNAPVELVVELEGQPPKPK